MVETIYYVTSNPGKVDVFNRIVSKLDAPVRFELLDYDWPEYKHDESLKTIAEMGPEHCAEKLGQKVIVTDVGIFIKALNGFPGINTAFTLKRIGCEGIVKLMERVKDREVEFRVRLAYCESGKKAVSFSGVTKGLIADKTRGNGGFGFDPIFIMPGHNETWGENPDVEERFFGKEKRD